MNQDQQQNNVARPYNEAQERLQLALPALAIAVVFLLSALLQVLINSIVMLTAPAVAENDWYVWVVAMLPMYFLAMPAAALLLRLIPAKAPQKQKLHPLMWFGFLSLCFALSLGGSYLGNLLAALLSQLTGLKLQNDVQQLVSVAPFGINLLFAGILAPIFEELFYRKLVIDRLLRYGDLPAILLSGVAFGLIHGNFQQFFYATAVGFLLGYVYVRTGNLLYTVSLHMAFNLIGGVFSTEILRRMNGAQLPPLQDVTGWLMLLAYLAFCGLAIIVSVVFICLFGKRFRASLGKGECTLARREWARVLLLNPGIWLFLLVAVLMFL